MGREALRVRTRTGFQPGNAHLRLARTRSRLRMIGKIIFVAQKVREIKLEIKVLKVLRSTPFNQQAYQQRGHSVDLGLGRCVKVRGVLYATNED